MYWVWTTLLILANLGAWILNVFGIPGNWLIVVFTAIFAFLATPEDGRGIGISSVGVIVVLAAMGELLEFLAGAAGAAKHGGSKRGMALAMAGTMVGSILGAVLGVPIPIVGPLVAAVGGGALGAFLGAYMGEYWKGRDAQQRLSISQGALVGRLLGTVGKLGAGGIMVVVVAIAAIW